MTVSPPSPIPPPARSFSMGKSTRHERTGSGTGMPTTTLLEAFPAPPTHIPSKPTTPYFQTNPPPYFPTNPPPSRPPSLPLPPVPGPSRISEHDLVLLSSANSRPASRRESVVCPSEGSNGVARTLSNASSSSRSNRSGPTVRPRPFIISGGGGQTTERLTRLAISPVPLSDDDYASDHIATSPPTVLGAPLRVLSARHHRHNDSISSIDIQDLAAVMDEEEPVVPPFNAFRVHDVAVKKPEGLTITVPPRATADPIDPHTITVHQDQHGIRPSVPTPPLPSGQSATLSFAMIQSSPPDSLPRPAPPLSPQELHLEIRTARSKSISHKQTLRARSSSRGPTLHTPAEEPVPPLPKSAPPISRDHNLVLPAAERPPSPDIDSIISATPRPARSLRKHPSSASVASTSEFGVNNRTSASVASGTRSSFASSLSVGTRSRKGSNVSTRELDKDLKMVWGEGEAESDGGEEPDNDDSSIDLHTPLPHLMVKHGLLSPRSKLLPQAELDRRASTPHLNDGRPGSTLSIGKKLSVMKDERNTPMRKERHRDGKLLRGGIGLTTGLGWSDSEDENAPSPLTRRLYNLNLTRRSSAAPAKVRHGLRVNGTRSASASARSSAVLNGKLHPLSRPYSGGAARGIAEDWEGDEQGVDEFGQRVEATRPRTISSSARAPPTSWHGRPKITTTNSLRPDSRLSPDTARNSQNSDDTIPTPSSTASASSILSTSLPQTPQDGDPSVIKGSISRKSARSEWDKDKNLPPLPLQPILKKQSSASKIAFPQSRSRAGSLTNSTSSRPSIPRSTTPSAASAQAAALARVTSPGPVRPLQLPQRYASDRPPVPVPSIPPTRRNSTSQTALQPPSLLPHPPSLTPSRSVPGISTRVAIGTLSTPTSPVMGPPSTIPLKPKPRTGTGMMYKKSTGPPMTMTTTNLAGIGAGPGKMRTPVALATSASISTTAMTASVSSGLAMRKNLAPINVGGAGAGAGAGKQSSTMGVPRTPTTPIGQAF